LYIIYVIKITYFKRGVILWVLWKEIIDKSKDDISDIKSINKEVLDYLNSVKGN
jgi:hypothetical protein